MGKHLTLNDRKFIEKMLKQKISVTVIADTLGVHRSTIYREIKKGTYLHTTKINGGFYKDVPTYSSDLGQQVYTNNRKKCVRPLKLSGDYLLEIESLLLKKYSPEMAVTACSYPHLVCTKTIYNYIDKCLFKKYRNVNLIHGKQKRHTTKDRTHKQKHSINNSIENRPVDILNREVFGHWEMDTVIGKIGKSNCLLVLTERKTRREFVYKLEDKTSKSVVNQLRALQRYYGKNYSKIFKTITVDNGAEFADVQGMKRFSGTQFYYCHPYSSWERGSNENRNKLIRRFIPKGTDIKKYSTDYIKSVEQFINNYPMRIHNYQKPIDLFNAELEKIVQTA